MLDLCDKCENMARVTVSGNNLNSYAVRCLCARHARDLCASLGDTAGLAHFTALMAGDRQGVSA